MAINNFNSTIIKTFYNKEKPWLVFNVYTERKVKVVPTAVVPTYFGILTDTKENKTVEHSEQVETIEVNWLELKPETKAGVPAATVNVNLGLETWQLNQRIVSDKETTAPKGRPYHNLIVWASGETGGSFSLLPVLKMNGEDITNTCLTVVTIGDGSSTGIGTNKGLIYYLRIDIPEVTGDIELTNAGSFNDEWDITRVDSINIIPW